MDRDLHNLSDVFGATRRVPLSYIARAGVDDRFTAALAGNRHIVLHGRGRQGKTSLHKRYLGATDYATVHCTYTQKRFDVYRMLLGEAGVSVSIEKKRKRARGISAKISIFSGETSSESEQTERSIEIDIANINDVLRVVRENGFARTAVIEEAHCLSNGVQRELASDLKIVFDRSDLRLVVVGAWDEPDRFVHLNGDLLGRTTSIRVPDWTPPDLQKVIEHGERLLNVVFSSEVKRALVEMAGADVGMLQELCYHVCDGAGITQTTARPTNIRDVALVADAQRLLTDSAAVRYRSFIARFSGGGRPIEIGPEVGYRGASFPGKAKRRTLMEFILRASPNAILDGIAVPEILPTLNAAAAGIRTFDRNDVLRLFRRSVGVQARMRMHPMVLSFDPSRETLDVVDRRFIAFVQASPLDELLAYLPRVDVRVPEVEVDDTTVDDSMDDEEDITAPT